MMLKAIFYSLFDTHSGRKVVHQVPDGAIVPSPTAPPGTSQLFDFDEISFFVIPRQELCGNLIQVCTNGYRVLGSPVCLKSSKYDRNEFIFNFCVVLSEDDEWGSFRSVVQKLADLMCELEEQSQFLSNDPSPSGEGKVHSVCDTLMEDLNNYCECMIPIDELNTLNVKLFPLYPPPPPVKAWHVPLFTVRYETFMDENWDLTMQRIVKYIDGIHSVRAISILSGADFYLTCRSIRHLIFFGCVFLLDIFSFSAIYATTAEFGPSIASDEEMQKECARYVNTLFSPSMSSDKEEDGKSSKKESKNRKASSERDKSDQERKRKKKKKKRPLTEDDIWPKVGIVKRGIVYENPADDAPIVDGVGIVQLYASLKQGQTIRQWYLENLRELAHIDVRRFITFGVIKGFLYRVHKYPYAVVNAAQTPNATAATATITSATNGTQVSYLSRSPSLLRGRQPATTGSIPTVNTLSSRRRKGTQLTGIPESNSLPANGTGEEPAEKESKAEESDYNDGFEIDDVELSQYLDGMHCFDEICTELEISERQLTMRLRQYSGEILIIQR